uniref:Uncharacterized protein n=1 Tax=Oryza punctata TaxID=4537 RepID=A0A0E0KAA7_ORYPU
MPQIILLRSNVPDCSHSLPQPPPPPSPETALRTPFPLFSLAHPPPSLHPLPLHRVCGVAHLSLPLHRAAATPHRRPLESPSLPIPPDRAPPRRRPLKSPILTSPRQKPCSAPSPRRRLARSSPNHHRLARSPPPASSPSSLASWRRSTASQIEIVPASSPSSLASWRIRSHRD